MACSTTGGILTVPNAVSVLVVRVWRWQRSSHSPDQRGGTVLPCDAAHAHGADPTAFRAIRFRLTLARGSPTTAYPDVRSITLIYRKKLPAKWGHTMELDLTSEHKGNTPLQQRASLLTAIESTSLVEFTLRDDVGDTRNFYVDVMSATGLEHTGEDERGSSLVTVSEP